MNLSGLDLNLLVVFDALMTERQVTRAGEKLGLSQPATSNALARLRKLTQDELLIRTARGLQPTPTALVLASQIQPALQQIQQALTRESAFEPATSNRTFTLGMSDYTAFTLLPKLLRRIQITAPQIAIQVRSGDRPKLLGLLDKGELDLLCGVFPEKVTWHRSQLLFRERYVCICRQDHPLIGESISLDTYVAASHLLVSIAEDRTGRIDHELAERNLARHIAISIPHFLVAPFILAQTDLVATLPEQVATSFEPGLTIKVIASPFPDQGFGVWMRWHQSNDQNLANGWLREQFVAISKELTIK